MTDALRRVIAARTAMLLDDPFFGSLALRLAVREDPTAESAWTDGTSLGFAPAFVASLSQDELKAVIAHEIMHCAAGHPWRRDGRERKKWNVAADYAINGLLAGAGYKLPNDVLMPDREQRGQSAEWIYARLPAPDGANGGGSPKTGPGEPDQQPQAPGEVRDAPSGTDDEATETQEDWNQAVQRAAQQAMKAGKLPAGLARMAAEAVRPKVDWRAELRALLERARADYSWAQPNRRYLAAGLYLPALDHPEMPALAIAVDTSGSVDDVALSAAKAELEAIIQDTAPAAVHVVYADAAVRRVDTFERGDTLTWAPAGGGGTDFAPVCGAVDALDPAPAALLYVSDLEGRFPADAPATPVIWVTPGALVAPFGRTLRMEAD